MEILRGERLAIFGCGYVGTALAAQAVRRGMEVWALTRNVSRANELKSLGAEPVVADLATDTWHERLPGEVRWVVNCVSSGGGGAEGYRRSYADGMRSLVAWLGGASVERLVYTSSTSVYPQGGGARVDEASPVEVQRETALILLAAEEILRTARSVATVLRLAGLYGPGRHSLLDQLRAGREVLAGAGDHRLNLVHRDDAVAAIWAVLTAPNGWAGQVFNVADDGAVTKAELATWLAQRLGRPLPRFDGVPLAGRRPQPLDRVIVNDKLKRLLGWRPTYPDFRAGYEAILDAL